MESGFLGFGAISSGPISSIDLTSAVSRPGLETDDDRAVFLEDFPEDDDDRAVFFSDF